MPQETEMAIELKRNVGFWSRNHHDSGITKQPNIQKSAHGSCGIFRSASNAFQEGIAVGNGDVLLSEAGQGDASAEQSAVEEVSVTNI